jgi:hypothetical protein
MFNNISFRDKIILFVLSVGVLVGIFIFAIMKPLTADIEELKVDRDAKKATWKTYSEKMDRLDGLVKNVVKLVEDSGKTQKEFTVEPVDFAFVDDMITAIIARNGINSSLGGSHPAAEEIEYYYNEVNEARDNWYNITYGLKQSADLDGSIAKKIEEAHRYEIAIAALEPQEIAVSTINFECHTTRENIMSFIDDIAEIGGAGAVPGEGKLDGTIRITNLEIDDYHFGAESEDPLEQGISKCSFDISLYHVEPLHFDLNTLAKETDPAKTKIKSDKARKMLEDLLKEASGESSDDEGNEE